MKKPSIGIAWKLIGSLVGTLVLLFGFLTYFIYSHHKSNLEKTVVDSAMNIAQTIKSTIIHDMMRSDCSEAFELIYTVSENEGIEKIRIFDKDGQIEYSSFPRERYTMVDKDAEQCTMCHSGAEPVTQPGDPKYWRIYQDENGDRVLGVINPIWNSPNCSTAECHYHSPERSVLGVLDVNMSLDRVDENVAGYRNLSILFFLISAGVIALISGLFILFMVHNPVKKLIDGMERISSGNLDHKIRINRDDELGKLANTFNAMTVDLKSAREDVEEWARTLEERVKEKTEELERAHRQIVRVEKMASLGKLSAIVAHEINNPLTGVLTYARLLQKKIDKKKTILEQGGEADFSDCFSHLHIIEQETARCGDIVKNLLMFSKKNTVNFEKNNFNELLAKSIKLVSHQLDLSEIELATDLGEKLPEIICDSGQIQQIFVALLINAVEAIGTGGEIRLSTRFDSETDQVVFRCEDNGPGMEPEVRRKIFEPFFTTKESTNGSGLGLAVVYGIVQRHGGRITVHSEPGKGATFIIHLPRNPPPEVDEFEGVRSSSQPDRL